MLVAPPEAQGLYDPQHEKDACGVGFVVHLKGKASRSIVAQGLELLHNLEHRGACGCEANTGDGAGIMVQIPDAFLRKVTAPLGFALPEKGHYGIGLVFLPHDAAQRDDLIARFEALIRDEDQVVLGWRDVPTDDSTLGDSARRAQPVVRQIFVGIGDVTAASPDPLAFERKLYVIRKRLEHLVDALDLAEKKAFYVVSLSSRTLLWKGMLTAEQLPEFFLDLRDPDFESALALVHQRFSTNTFPSWPLAHPYRVIAHNGEINTLRGNINWMRAREGLLASPLFGEATSQQMLPIIREGGSDTAIFDNVLEFLIMSGRSLPHAMLMMIPEPWQNHESMEPARRAFYEYHSSLMEPWDGPASIAFTDGTMIGAVLDRNGLRPSRYYVTKDDLVVMACEVGVLDIPPENIRCKERLQPGKVFLVDTAQGRIVDDEEIKSELAAAQPVPALAGRAPDRHPRAAGRAAPAACPITRPCCAGSSAFGYTEEDLRLLLAPMAQARRGGGRLDGHRHAAGGAVDQAAAAVQLLQAAVRAGHQPAARRDPRGARHVDGLDHRPGGQPARAEAGVVPPDRGRVPGPQQRGSGQAALRRRRRQRDVDPAGVSDAAGDRRLQDAHAADAVRSGAGRPRPREGDRRAVRRRPAPPSRTASTSSSSPIAAWTTPTPPSRACWRRPACTTTWSARARARSARSWSRRATRARCTTSRCSIGYGAGAVNPYLAFETLDDMIRQRHAAGPDAREGGRATTSRRSTRASSR